jgi:DNA polymerase III delta prime subunit
LQSASRETLRKQKVKIHRREKQQSQLHATGTRRSAAAIFQHQKQLQAELSACVQPQQKILGEAEKNRLSAHMQYRGSPPDQEDRSISVRSQRSRTTQEHELDSLFASIEVEIDDRKEHLHFLLSTGKSNQDAVVVQMQKEIVDRTRELHKVHGLILDLPRLQ